MPVLAIEHIVQTSDVSHGAPRINGTRIRVQDVVAWHVRGDWSVQDIVEQFDLTYAQVYAALAYYDHQAEIDRDLAESDSVEAGESLEVLRERIEQRRRRKT